jgi:ribose 5-phosphate isomerase A
VAPALDEPEVLAQKRDAAARAAALVRPGMVVGLGSGTTALLAVEEIARRLASGALRAVVGVPTSRATAEWAQARGIPLTDLERHPLVDLTIDGADEVSPEGDLLKGAGGALLREKIVARASRRLAIVVDESKRVDRLGRRHPLPVEVVAFGWSTHAAAARALGAEPVLRRDGAGAPYTTDEGHLILDCRFPDGIGDAAAVERALKSRAGVVETGLFLGLSPEVIVGRRGYGRSGR